MELEDIKPGDIYKITTDRWMPLFTENSNPKKHTKSLPQNCEFMIIQQLAGTIGNGVPVEVAHIITLGENQIIGVILIGFRDKETGVPTEGSSWFDGWQKICDGSEKY